MCTLYVLRNVSQMHFAIKAIDLDYTGPPKVLQGRKRTTPSIQSHADMRI